MSGLEAVTPYASALLRAFLDSVGVGVLVSIAICVVTRRNPKLNAATRHVLWCAALLCIALMPIIGFAHSLSRREVSVTPNAIQAGIQVSTLQFAGTQHIRKSAQTQAAFQATWKSRVVRRLTLGLNALQGLSIYAVAAWLLIAIAGMASLVRGIAQLAAAKRAALPIAEPFMIEAPGSRRASRRVRICASDQIKVPVAAGLWSPTILLPRALVDEAPADMLEQIISHEGAHLGRYDDWTNVMQRVIERLFWFNPAVSFVSARIELEREMACDDWAVAKSGNDRRYAACLLHLARSGGFHKLALAAPAAMLRSQLAARIEHVLDEGRNRMPGTTAASVLVALPLLMGALLFVQQQAPAMAVAQDSKHVSIIAAHERMGSGDATSASLPEARNRTKIRISGVVVIVSHDPLKDTDIIQIDASRINPADVYAKLRAYHNRSGNGMIIKAAPDVKYSTVLTLMDAAHQAGFSKFGLANRVQGLPTAGGAPAGFEKRLPTNPRLKITSASHLRPIEVTVNASDQVWIDGKLTPSAALYKAMAQTISFHREHAAQGYSTHIALVADQGTSWKTIIRILDAAKQAGVDDLGFVTQ